MGRMRSRLTYANVMATIAVFLVLGGGTALGAFVVSSNSQIGPGTVSGHKPPQGDHSNVIAGSLNSTDLAGGAVTNGKLAGVHFLHATSAALHDAPGGGGASQSLFSIGRVPLSAFCQNQGGGQVVAGIELGVDEAGPILVADGEGSDPDFVHKLQPADVQFIVILNSSSGLAAQEKSFAILDDSAHTSASGVAAASVQPGLGDCRITLNAVG
jgi:hypothetical protein